MLERGVFKCISWHNGSVFGVMISIF
jgi:hypothetical protein